MPQRRRSAACVYSSTTSDPGSCCAGLTCGNVGQTTLPGRLQAVRAQSHGRVSTAWTGPSHISTRSAPTRRHLPHQPEQSPDPRTGKPCLITQRNTRVIDKTRSIPFHKYGQQSELAATARLRADLAGRAGRHRAGRERHRMDHRGHARGDRLLCTYDFGDGWEHDITLERVLPVDAGTTNVICTSGKGACPPEDRGGASATRS